MLASADAFHLSCFTENDLNDNDDVFIQTDHHQSKLIIGKEEETLFDEQLHDLLADEADEIIEEEEKCMFTKTAPNSPAQIQISLNKFNALHEHSESFNSPLYSPIESSPQSILEFESLSDNEIKEEQQTESESEDEPIELESESEDEPIIKRKRKLEFADYTPKKQRHNGVFDVARFTHEFINQHPSFTREALSDYVRSKMPDYKGRKATYDRRLYDVVNVAEAVGFLCIKKKKGITTYSVNQPEIDIQTIIDRIEEKKALLFKLCREYKKSEGVKIEFPFTILTTNDEFDVDNQTISSNAPITRLDSDAIFDQFVADCITKH